jgi:hypothetical protein
LATADLLPACTVVVPARDAAAILPRCLSALKRQTQENVEIIAIDDGSSDETSEVARRHGARVVRQAPLGPAAARNLGVRTAHGPVVLFTDADCAPEPQWAEALTTALADPNVVGVKGVYTSKQRQLVARFVQLDYEDRYRRMEAGDDTIDFVDTYAAGYRRSVLLGSGGFDESFAHASVEDHELSFRLAAQGLRFRFEPAARVEHLHPVTLNAYVRKKFKIGYYKPRVHVRAPEKLVADSHTPGVLRLQTLAGAVAILLLPAAPFSTVSRRMAIALVTGIAGSSLPLAVRNGMRDPVVGLITPPLVVVRGFALAAGLLTGFVSLAFRRFSAQRTGLAHHTVRQGANEWVSPKAD